MLTLYFREELGFVEIAELLDIPGAELQETYGRAAVHIRAALLPARIHGLYTDMLNAGSQAGE